MKFDKLNDTVPYVVGGKSKVLRMNPYPNITLRLPGRHAKETEPVGGDFVVCVNDINMGWDEHQFTHTDLFNEFEKHLYSSNPAPWGFMDEYLKVIKGSDPSKADFSAGTGLNEAVALDTLLHAVQCLAVAEHRRYARFEKQFGGRYLPFRFSAGIVEGLWTADEASSRQKYGRPAVERLEKERGVPAHTKELMEL